MPPGYDGPLPDSGFFVGRSKTDHALYAVRAFMVDNDPKPAVASIKKDLKSGGPYFVADPFGGDRSILLAIESGQVVALSDIKPGTKDCRVRWRGSIDSFVDCKDRKLQSTDLARYQSEVAEIGAQKGELLIDLRHRLAAPAAS